MSTRVESRLVTCGSKAVQEQVWNYMMGLADAGMEIPETIDGRESESNFHSCTDELMEKLSDRFENTLFVVDFDTMEPYREYWFNGKKSEATAAFDAPDFDKLEIPPDAAIDWNQAGTCQAIQTASGLLTVHMGAGQEDVSGITIRRDGQTLLIVTSREDTKKLSVCVSGTPSVQDESKPSSDLHCLVLNPAQFKIMRGLSDLGATQIKRTGDQLLVQFGGEVTWEQLVIHASVFPFIEDGDAHLVSELFQRHYENRDWFLHNPDETTPILRVDGDTAFAGPVTPVGTLSAHFRNGDDYPGISVHCNNKEVVRVEYHNNRNELRSYVYADDTVGTELEPTKEGYVPYCPKQQM